jgi:hypothetical protein
VIGNKWLNENYDSVPSEESVMGSHHIRGSTFYSSSIHSTKGVYPAELHTGSKSRVFVINTYSNETQRKRMRMSCKSLL